MFVVFRCNKCGRFLCADMGQKTRECPCGKRVEISKAKVYARADDARSAGELVRRFQQKEVKEGDWF